MISSHIVFDVFRGLSWCFIFIYLQTKESLHGLQVLTEGVIGDASH